MGRVHDLLVGFGICVSTSLHLAREITASHSRLFKSAIERFASFVKT